MKHTPMKKRGLALLLALAMVLSLAPTAFAAGGTGGGGFALSDSGDPASGGQTGGLRLPAGSPEATDSSDSSLGISAEVVQGTGQVTQDALEGGDSQPASVNDPTRPDPDDQVTFIVELEQKSLLAYGYSAQDIANGTADVRAYEARQRASLERLKDEIRATVDSAQALDFGYTYTVASTGLSVTTAYKNQQALEQLSGVKDVYVAPTFHIPETDDQLNPQTSNATGMIGAGTVNQTGFTGKGMRIAIIDTGLKLPHPSFGELAADQLTDSSLTPEELTSIWSQLKANEAATPIVPRNAYYSSKVPFIYNYALQNLDVSHTGAGSDHGTHVAGIAAANQLDSTEVVGVAPEAQVLVMQVFDAYGASWDVVMAALEDCVPLDVDVANLSLGSAAGFTDGDQNMNNILNTLKSAGVQIIIAAGNDTNSAYNNYHGGYSQAGNPDVGLVATPSTYFDALSVASADNDAVTQLYFTVNGREIGYGDTGTNNDLFSKYSGDSLEFVVLSGYGDAASYEDESGAPIDVEGKVVVVSRGGGVSFMDKQTNAQSHGAIACVVYNNTSGILNMQVNTGAEDIPCVSISQTDGQYLVELGAGTLTVCTDGAKEFHTAAGMSSFSSWGSTPDLKLKPEITGVGGNIYSTRDPAYGGEYGYMSGTSMASPQVAGAMAVVTQYLREQENYGKNAEAWKVAANLLMSTADPLLYSTDVEYSPRQQGAGLVDLVGATTAGAYLSNIDSENARPKAEVGESADGTYTFQFSITNFSDEEKSYRFDSSLITETYDNGLIGNRPYALGAQVVVAGGSLTGLKYDFNGDGSLTTADARLLLQSLTDDTAIPADDPRHQFRDVDGDSQVDRDDVTVMIRYFADRTDSPDLNQSFTTDGAGGDTVTIPAGQTQEFTASIALTPADKSYLAQFPNGMYVEGFLYAESTDGTAAENLTMPILGYYGDWSKAPVFDDPDTPSHFAPAVYTSMGYAQGFQLGDNPYIRTSQRVGEAYGVFSYQNPLEEIDLGLLRNARVLRFTVTNPTTGAQYFTNEYTDAVKTYFSDTYGQVVPFMIYNATPSENAVWRGYDQSGRVLASGTQVEYKVEAFLDDGDNVADDTWTFPVTVDTTAPQVLNANNLQGSLDTSSGKAILTLQLQDDTHVAAILLKNSSGTTVGKFEPDASVQAGSSFDQAIDITGLGSTFTVTVADYACNETDVNVTLTGTEVENPTVQQLDPNRLYGNENITTGPVDLGWFSVGKDLTGARNETFSTDTYFSGEYVNGYVVAQRNNGDVVMLTPYGTYWNAQTIIPAAASAEGQSGFQTLYDMALQYNADGPDRLFAVGWTYDGTVSGSAYGGQCWLYEIVFPQGGTPQIREHQKITGLGTGEEMVCLAISDNGTLYGISTTGVLWTIDEDTGACTRIREITEFTNLQGYNGLNVIQSMCYDHGEDVIYWAAHSQTFNGLYYNNLCQVLTIDPNQANAPAEVIGTMGHSGASALFVPTDQTSDLFTSSSAPTALSINPEESSLLAGASQTMEVIWSPWNADPVALTWTSSDDTVARVDQNGVVTAVGEGTATITATSQDGSLTDTATVHVRSAESTLYGFVATAGGSTSQQWITYNPSTPMEVTTIGSASQMWQGGAYYEGNLYTVEYPRNTQGMSAYVGTVVYKSPVTVNSNGSVTIGTPVELHRTPNIEVGNLAIDYNTGRMYGVDLTNGGLVIVDTMTGMIDPLGTFQFDDIWTDSSEYVMTAMAIICEGAETTILVGSMNGNLWTVDPDTLHCTSVGTAGQEYWNYAAMTYDYNTGNIYWNPSSEGDSPLLMITLEENTAGQLRAQITDLGYVQRSGGVEQTVMFSIPENEPETTIIPVESMWIVGEETRSALQGAVLQLETDTTPNRPTVRAVEWTSSNQSVATVDAFGKVTFRQVGTTTITATLNDRNGNRFTDSVHFTVVPSAGNLQAILTQDTATGYYDFWITVPDHAPEKTTVGPRVMDMYNLRAGEYYDGNYYGYEADGSFVRVSASNTQDYVTLGQWNNLSSGERVTDLAFDYTTGTMYALAANGNTTRLMTVNMSNGQLTQKANLSQTVYTLAASKTGALYAVGSPAGVSDSATIYKLTVNSSSVSAQQIGTMPAVVRASGDYNPQMTYHYATNRLYLNAGDHGAEVDEGLYMLQLDEGGNSVTNTAALGKIGLYINGESTVGDTYLGLLCAIPAEGDLPEPTQEFVTGVSLNTHHAQLQTGDTVTLTAQVQPNTAQQTVTWSSNNTSVATVDASGKVTAVGVGTATITATSTVNTSISDSCTVTVIADAGNTLAYAITKEHGLISFNPQIPGEYTVVGDIPQKENVIGMDVSGSDVYYLVNSGNDAVLYRYNMNSKLSTMLGALHTYTTSYCDLAYDPEQQVIYVACGLYIYQYYVPSLRTSGMNLPAGAVQPEVVGQPSLGSVYGVTVVDGKAISLSHSQGRTFLYRVDSFSGSGSCTFLGWIDGLDIASGSTEFTYDQAQQRFYVTNVRNELYTFTMDQVYQYGGSGSAQPIGSVGGGLNVTGLAIANTASQSAALQRQITLPARIGALRALAR